MEEKKEANLNQKKDDKNIIESNCLNLPRIEGNQIGTNRILQKKGTSMKMSLSKVNGDSSSSSI